MLPHPRLILAGEGDIASKATVFPVTQRASYPDLHSFPMDVGIPSHIQAPPDGYTERRVPWRYGRFPLVHLLPLSKPGRASFQSFTHGTLVANYSKEGCCQVAKSPAKQNDQVTRTSKDLLRLPASHNGLNSKAERSKPKHLKESLLRYHLWWWRPVGRGSHLWGKVARVRTSWPWLESSSRRYGDMT